MQPVSAAFLNWVYLQEPSTNLSLSGLLLAVAGIYHFSKDDFNFSACLPVILATVLISARDVCIKLSTPSRRDPDEEGDHPEETTCSMSTFSALVLRTLPIAAFALMLKVLRHGFHSPTITPLIRNAAMLALYHVTSVALIPRIDTITHSVVGTLKRFTGILFAILVFRVPLSDSHVEGLGLAFIGFAMYIIGRRRQKLGAPEAFLAIVSGVLVFGVFLFQGGIVIPNVPKINLDVAKTTPDVTKINPDAAKLNPIPVNVTGSVERVDENTSDSRKYMIIPLNDYQSAWDSLTYTGYDQAVNHGGGNVGNLIWKYATHERLIDLDDTPTCKASYIKDCAEKARSKGMSPVMLKPVANLLNPNDQKVFGGTAGMIEGNGVRILIIGLGVQVEFRLGSNDPEFNSSAKITTSSVDFVHPENTKAFLRVMSESGGEMLLRGQFALNVTRSGGFTRGHSLGCPSLFINDDVRLGKTLEEKYKSIVSRRGDRTLKVAVNLKRKCRGIAKQIVHFRDNYPNSRFYAQGPGDMKILQELKVPFERTRLFSKVEDWIEDLREMDVSYGLRIHGNMVSLGAGLPVVVAASDWRVLELVQVMKIPHVITYDPILADEDVDIAKVVEEMGTFDGDAFDRNRCEIAKVYIRVFQKYGIGVRRHVTEISKLC